jgi:thiamine biosynthesis lipoprotein
VAVSRARPFLGTLVRISCDGLPEFEAHRRIDQAFDEISCIQNLMSFHSIFSDVSRMNCEAAHKAVSVDKHTISVLRYALDISQASNGVFDISVGGALVEKNNLPRPNFLPLPDSESSWRDIELTENDQVRFHRPLWVDLGGIAKGYAVDCAIERVADNDEISWCVNAGGDLRISGPQSKKVMLNPVARSSAYLPLVELTNASLASSEGQSGVDETSAAGMPLDGRKREALDRRRFASVIAERAVIADALTKIVLVQQSDAMGILKRFDAAAIVHSPDDGWSELNPRNRKAACD